MMIKKEPGEGKLPPESTPGDNAVDVGKGEGVKPESSVPLPNNWSDTMDDVIEEAMANGVFDNLPGQGKPLNLSKNPYNPESELAFEVLKNNNYTLPWIAERNGIMKEIEAFRNELRRTWLSYQAEYRVAKSELVISSLRLHWNSHLERWQEEIGRLNNKIAFANLKQPIEKLEIMTLALESELNRAGANKEMG